MSRQRRYVRIEEDIIYVNASIYNDTDAPIIANYSTTFQEPFVKDIGEYQMSLIRFSIPNTISIFEFVNNKYYITLSYDGDDFSVPLEYVRRDFRYPEQNINTFQEFIDIINTGFTTAFNNLKAQHAGAPPTEAPYMVFDDDADTFSLYAQQSYNTNNNTIEIFFNHDLYNFFFDSFKVNLYGVNLPTKKDIQFIITNELNNIPTSPANYYRMRQETPTLYQWYDLHMLYFTTDMHIKHELITTISSGGRSVEDPLLTDFIPDFSRNDRSQFIYNADPYRLIDCVGHGPTSKFNFGIRYITKNNERKLYYIEPGNTITCKFAFIKKELKKYIV